MANSLSPRELFDRCSEHASQLGTGRKYKSITEHYVQGITFRASFSVTDDKLVQLLRGAADNETRWFLLGVWVKEQNICEPKDFLPAKFYGTFTRDIRKKFQGISPKNIRYFNLVETWTPYFERLITDFRAINEKNRRIVRGGTRGRRIDPTENLKRAGYDPDAAGIIVKVNGRKRGKRSAVAAACAWLAHRRCGDEFRIRNAHSLLRSYLSKGGHNVDQLLQQFREEAGLITKA